MKLKNLEDLVAVVLEAIVWAGLAFLTVWTLLHIPGVMP